MTLEPETLGPDDVRSVLALGVSRQAIADAMHVAFLFNVFDRLADAMDWDVPAEGSAFWQVSAKMLLSRGYR